MPTYLEINYPQDEYGPDKYPQKLCNYLTEHYFRKEDDLAKVLLDIGSGRGNHLVGFARNGMIAKGIDKTKETLDILSGFDIRECDLEKDLFPFEGNHFDFVFSKSVLEHVCNTDNAIRETYRVLKPGGITVQLTPDWATDYKIFWDDPTHVRPFTQKGLKQAFLLHNFIEVNCERFYQLPFLWKYPSLTFITHIIALLPDSLKWKDNAQRVQRILIRHAKERMLLLSARKPYQK
ncbi:class I SAM-dependent methyltransferase [Candidatus Parcubacteria bacterium]|nr:MAG: class I SAM-dependent methyltransferase [Candidatus Parcubacteria bacterium]